MPAGLSLGRERVANYSAVFLCSAALRAYRYSNCTFVLSFFRFFRLQQVQQSSPESRRNQVVTNGDQ